MMKSWFSSRKKVIVIITAVLLSVAAGLGGWYLFSASRREPVYVFPFHFIGMTEYWGDSQESYGPVSTDKIQTVFLSETQEVTKIAVKEGDSIKKGDLLLQFDTTLSDLQLERKRLAVEKLKLQLQDAETKLYEINGLVPAEQIQMPDNSIYYDDDLGPMIHSQGFEICENTDYNGSSPYQPLVLWLSQNQSLNHNILSELKTMAEYLQTMNSYTEQDDGSLLYQPVSVDSFCVVVRITENDQQFAGKTTWQGLRVNASDYSIRFFTPTVIDPMDSTDSFNPPETGAASHYTAAQIAQMRADAEKKIRDLAFQIKMAESEYKIMQKEVSDGNIYAEIDGEVVSLLTPEEAVSTRQPLIKVSGGGGFFVEGYVSELEKDKLKLGTEVTINDWNTGETYTAKVSSIGDFPTVEAGFNGMGNPNASYYPFLVYVDGSADLQTGSYVSIQYSTSEGGNGVYLENPFLRTENGITYVLVLGADGKLEQRNISTGKSLWGNYTQITSGLSPEDLIAFPYGKDAKPGVAAVEGDMSNLYG